MKKEDNEMLAGAVAILIILAIVPVGWVFKSYMEAKSYNEVTGKNVTTWQAMWIDLRVQDSPK